MAKIKHSFSDVLSNNLNPTPMETPMVINLRENTKALKVLAAQRVPKIYEEPVEHTLQEF